ncbi:MAG: CpaF family protein [Ilumatobacteraceae bacterium]|jgi:pilus assembly protein CpaF
MSNVVAISNDWSRSSALARWFADPLVREIMVNAGREIWIEREGGVEHVGTLGNGELTRIIERILLPIGRRVDQASPVVDARLADGSRVCIVIPPVAVDGPCLSIRRFHVRDLPLSAFGDDDVVSLLRDIVAQRCNVVVAGAASSGKTTLLNALCGCVNTGERLITVEDIAELRLQTEHVLRLEARPATYDGSLEVGLSTLLRSALRMRPDRFVLGEVRGSEALDMLTAMNTGHNGSLATCHANSPDDALRRIESMVLQAAPQWPLTAVREHLQAAVDVIVQVERSPNGHRRVARITEVSMRPDVLGTKTIWAPGAAVARLSRGRS